MSDRRTLRVTLAELGLDVRGSAASWAAFSPCGRYRYALGRSWEPLIPGKTLVAAGHNPSTATDEKTDNTLGLLVKLAKREGCTALVLVNRFAWRSTDKKPLLTVGDPVGPLNDLVVKLALDSAAGGPILFCWGRVDHRIDDVRDWFFGRAAKCLSKNVDGSPGHPLYLPGDAPLLEWP